VLTDSLIYLARDSAGIIIGDVSIVMIFDWLFRICKGVTDTLPLKEKTAKEQ